MFNSVFKSEIEQGISHKTKVENEIKVFLQTNLLDMSLREIVHELTLSRYCHKWTGTWTPKLRVQRRISINFVDTKTNTNKKTHRKVIKQITQIPF